jgi:predicted transcriptional regulator
MKVHKWKDIKRKRFSDEQIREIKAAAAEGLGSIRRLREALGLTQADVAKLASMTQSEVSRFETREDHKISSLREMVEALGGELEVVAVVGGKRVRVA